jgi:hypothetical protein
MADLIFDIVNRPIDLDRELCRRAIEIENVWPDWMLPTEFQAVQATAP